jgi:hypothetical protein
VVLDSATLEATPFYDAPIWDQVLRDRPFRCVTIAREPRLMALEPSMTTRVLRRAFVEREGIDFPLGRLFEDPPSHIHSLVAAARIGLRNETLYWYRVNRPGKITAARGEVRFDAILSIRDALRVGLRGAVSADAGAYLLLGSARMLFWCCQHLTNDSIVRFVSEASATLHGAPEAWKSVAMRLTRQHPDLVRILGAFLHGDPAIVCAMAVQRPSGIMPAMRFMLSSFGGSERRAMLAGAARRMLLPASRIVRHVRRLAT